MRAGRIGVPRTGACAPLALSHEAQDRVSEGLELPRTDPGDLEQRVVAARARARDLGERRVGEDDERGHLGLARGGRPPLAQPLEELEIGLGLQRGRAAPRARPWSALPPLAPRPGRRREARQRILAGAGVARVPARWHRLAEVAADPLVPAAVAVGEVENRADLALLGRRLLLVVAAEPVPRHHVGPRVEEDAVRRTAVAPRAPDLLVVGLRRA